MTNDEKYPYKCPACGKDKVLLKNPNYLLDDDNYLKCDCGWFLKFKLANGILNVIKHPSLNQQRYPNWG